VSVAAAAGAGTAEAAAVSTRGESLELLLQLAPAMPAPPATSKVMNRVESGIGM
jgi:hypothetical protein